MSIQIIIDGKHSTDVLAELKILSDALNGQQLPEPKVIGVDPAKQGADQTVITEVKREVVEEERVQEKPKKLFGKQHKEEADKMIAAGEINNDIFPLLSKKQQERVEDEIMIKEEPVGPNVLHVNVDDGGEVDVISGNASEFVTNEAPTKEEPDVGGLFDDEPSEESTVTLEEIQKLIVSKARTAPTKEDPKGKDIPEMYAAVRAEIRNLVSKEEEPKLSNIPVEKYPALYNAINNL